MHVQYNYYSCERALHLQQNASQVYDSDHGSQGKFTESSNVSIDQKPPFDSSNIFRLLLCGWRVCSKAFESHAF